jgi:hypothetical protein
MHGVRMLKSERGLLPQPREDLPQRTQSTDAEYAECLCALRVFLCALCGKNMRARHSSFESVSDFGFRASDFGPFLVAADTPH